VIAASRRELAQLVAAGAVRDDLAWRLRAVEIAVPALVDRLDDLPALVRASLARIAGRLGRQLAITDAALARLGRHPWPGNVRELRHAVEEAAALATGGVIDVEHLPLPAALDGPTVDLGQLRSALAPLAARLCAAHPGAVHAKALDLLDAALLAEALARTGGNQLRAAELLGINRGTVKKRMDELGLG
jgi:two-component system nitrogen regulation response regulator GlnG